MPSLQPPQDESIRTLYVDGLDKRINEQDIRDKFNAHGEIETIRMVPSRACALVIYTTREGAEKAAQVLSNMLVIKGIKLKLWWAGPRALKPEPVVFNKEREQAFGKVHLNDTILKLQRTAPYYNRIRTHVCSFYGMGEMPVTKELSRIKDRYYGVNDSVAMKILKKAGEMPSLQPPQDESIRTLYVDGLDKRINEQDIRDKFNAHGEIETIRMVPSRACALVIYTTREGAEKAAQALSNMLVIKGIKLKLWWAGPRALKPEPVVFNKEREQAFGKVHLNDTILKLQRTAPYYNRIRTHVCSFYGMGEMPVTKELSRIKDRYYGVNDSVAMKILKKAGEMPSLEPPDDESIRTLYVSGFDKRINEPDLRDNLGVHGKIETIKMMPSRACAFVTYMTRESAEKAVKELSNKLVIKGLRLKLMWGRSQAPKLDSAVSDEARQQVANLSELLQNQVLQPPGIQDQHPAPHCFNIPPLAPQQGRAYYPLQDSQRLGAGNPFHEGTFSGSSENKSGSQKQ